MKTINVLVTGSHRSGTTWLAKVLSSSPLAHYTPEPFNLSFKHPGNPFKHWFQYIPVSSDDTAYADYINKFLEFTWEGAVQDVQKIKSKSLLKSYVVNHYKKITRPVHLIKDPIAVMSVEWMVRRFDMKVIVVIRHPAAFVSSIKVKDWKFDFRALLQQEELVNEYFPEYKKEIEMFAAHPPEVTDQAIMLWGLIYSRVEKYKLAHKDWVFVRHEDISKDPYHEIKKITDYIGIPLDEDITRAIAETTSGNGNQNSIEASLRDTIKRNSAENIYSWKNRLTAGEIKSVKERSRDIWEKFYSETDW